MRDKINVIKQSLGMDVSNCCPIIVTLDGVVVDGNHRVIAARELRLKTLKGIVIPLKITEINLDDLTLGWQPTNGDE